MCSWNQYLQNAYVLDCGEHTFLSSQYCYSTQGERDSFWKIRHTNKCFVKNGDKLGENSAEVLPWGWLMKPQAGKKSLSIKFPSFPLRSWRASDTRSSLTGSHTVLTHPWTCILGEAATCWDRRLASVANSDDFGDKSIMNIFVFRQL